MMNTLVEMKGLKKSFGGIQALKGVDLSIFGGEVHGLLGENGAGKSTLMRILCGIQQPDEGSIEIEGRPVDFKDPRHAMAQGIGMIPQELILADDMNLAENIYLGCELLTSAGLLDHRLMQEKASALLKSLGCDYLSPEAKVATLSKADQQMVALARRMVQGGNVFVMDEPTAALTEKEVQKLFNVMKKICDEGKAVVFISHRLEEVLKICNRFTILRDGERVAHFMNSGALTKNDLIAPMIGSDIAEEFPYEQGVAGDTLLELKDVAIKTDQSRAVRNINLRLRAGQVIGITGLVGMGKSELAQAMVGLRRTTEGSFFYKGKAIDLNSPEKARKIGIGYVSEDRRGEGLILNMKSLFNMSLRSLHSISKFFVLNRQAERALGNEYAEKFNMKLQFLDLTAGKLSGGNQQKVVLIRQMMGDAEIILLDEPTKGIDVGAKAEIARMVSRMSKGKKSICIFSSEPREVLGMSDLVYVMNHKGFQGPYSRADLDYKRLMALEFDAAEESVV